MTGAATECTAPRTTACWPSAAHRRGSGPDERRIEKPVERNEWRARLIAAKKARNEAVKAYAFAKNDGRPSRFSEEDIQAFRLAVDVAAFEARNAGVDISDLVGPEVGNLND
jgi:hypothetical protein